MSIRQNRHYHLICILSRQFDQQKLTDYIISMNDKKTQQNQIYILFFIASIIGLFIVKDYLTPLILGMFIAILSMPLFHFLLQFTVRLHWKKVLNFFYKNNTEVDENRIIAAVGTVLTTVGMIALLVSLIGTVAGNNLKFVFNQPIDEGISTIMANPTFKTTFGQYYDEKEAKLKITEFFNQYKPATIINSQGKNIVTNSETRITVSKYLSTIFTNFFNFAIFMVIFLFSWIVMMISGKDLLNFIYKFAFLTKDEQNIVNTDVNSAVKNVLIGNAVGGSLISLGVAALCIYFKIPLVAIWSILAFFIGFLPLTASEIGFVPVLVGIFFTSGLQATVIAAIIAEVYILILNNILLPKITAGKETNPLLILVSVFAAINFFGFAGFVIGPILVYLLMALYKIADARLKIHNGEMTPFPQTPEPIEETFFKDETLIAGA
jgi:predicted PurR-regulated permease PerM